MSRNDHCCLCGALRRPTQQPVESFGNGLPIIQMDKHRPMLPGRWEHAPQMLVNVSMWRNGGTAPGQTHMCDDCIIVGLRHAKEFVDRTLIELGALPVENTAILATRAIAARSDETAQTAAPVATPCGQGE